MLGGGKKSGSVNNSLMNFEEVKKVGWTEMYLGHS